MIIPSIDLMSGNTVQLIGGEKKAIDAGDPLPIAERFSIAGEIAVIDLDAAIGQGSNESVIKSLISGYKCRVGGGIRSYETAIKWLDSGAQKIILGTAAKPELLSKLPKERVIAAVDSRHGEIVVEGWRKGTKTALFDKINELKEYVGGFLVTFVEREGRMQGIDLELCKKVVEAAAPAKVTLAGGVTTLEELAEIDRMVADAQVGMALYSNKMGLADAIFAPLKSDRPDGLVPTVIVDEHGVALGLAYSNRESVSKAVELKRGVYYSRSRGGIWIKGETSGNTQELLEITPDCDRDTLRFTVRQKGEGFCHTGTQTCFGDDWGISNLFRRIKERIANPPPNSYTRRLIDENGLLGAKILEEAKELTEARTQSEIVFEAADVIYFTLVSLAKAGGSLEEVEKELDRRSLKVTRRPGNAKVKPEGKS